MQLSITGLGILTTCGIGAPALLAAVAQAQPICERPLTAPLSFALAADQALPDVGEVPEFHAATYLGDKGLRTLDRLTKLMVVGARMALQSAGLKQGTALAHYASTDIGVVTSNAYGSLEAITELDRVAELEDARYINPSKFPNTVANSASGYISIWEELRALNVAVSGGNTGALDAFACAEMFLESDRAKAIVVGGAEAMSEALFMAFDKLRPKASPARLAEGAAFFVLECRDVATARGANVLAHVCGYGTAFVPDEADLTLLQGSQRALERAIEDALQMANVGASEIALVVTSLAHNPVFDGAEIGALHTFVPRAKTLDAKLLFGETLGASGAIAIAAGIAACSATNSAIPAYLLVTALGYYGSASALLLEVPVGVQLGTH